jgi:hypothetical protein
MLRVDKRFEGPKKGEGGQRGAYVTKRQSQCLGSVVVCVGCDGFCSYMLRLVQISELPVGTSDAVTFDVKICHYKPRDNVPMKNDFSLFR